MKVIRVGDVPTPLADPKTFTGRAFGQNYHNAASAKDNIYVNNVILEPGARTWWHRHDHGQVIYVIAGRGVVSNESGETAFINPGDLVVVPANEWHWHGAVPASFVMHLTVNPGNLESTVYRDQEVTDDEYRRACGL